MKKFRLNRRTVLRGMLGGSAVAVGLPLLEAMLDDNGEALANGDSLPCRFVSWFWGNGVYLPTFEPAAVGDTWELSESLQPFGPIKDYVNLCTGLQNRCRNIITHHEGMCAFSGFDIQPFSGPAAFNSHMGGPTIDQLVADVIAGNTPVRSIHVGVDRKISQADGGTTMAAISHRGENDPEFPEHDPTKVWQQLFGSFTQTNEGPLRLGIVSAVKEDINRLQSRVGAADKAALDKHLEGLSELEKKINTMPPACEPPAAPTETNPDVPNQMLTEVGDVMDRLVLEAFKCDVTRVVTNLFHYGASHFHFHMLGQQSFEHHNDNSHAGNNANGRYTAVVSYIMERLANLAILLQQETLPNGENLLDSTIIYASSDCSNGWSHTINRQPIILIGHGREALRYPGIHYQATAAGNLGSDYPTAAGNTSDALLAVLQCYDPQATQIGDLGGNNPPGSTTPLNAIRNLG